ncbi:MAG: PQQ-dependent sugar dehydrogenase, partial [Roseimicrobium sp.]
MRRRSSPASCIIVLALAFVSCALGQPYGLGSRPAFSAFHNGTLPTNAPTFSGNWSTVTAFPTVTFLNALGICELPGQAANARRMVVWEREGRVYSFPKNAAAVNADKLLMLDITAKCQGWDDSGLLGLAFHPNFGSSASNNRFVFLYYTYVSPGTVSGSATARPPTFKANRDRLARFTVNLDGTIDPASETIFIDQVSASIWHNGGGMFFHPDNGFLYLTNGDDAQSTVNAQRIDRGLYSGVLRIDVDQRGGTISKPINRQPQPSGSVAQNYYIPLDNPFVGQVNALEEFFCIGLRSPHRMTIDPVTKRIFIGDVGLASWEELDVIEPTESALNFQWDDIEGLNGDLTQPYIGTNKRPILHYPHTEGSAIIGGYVYRGAEFAADLGGKYVFGDNGSGLIWYLDESTSPPTKVPLATLPTGSGPSAGSNYIGLSSFGVDADGELYLCQMSSLGGRIYKLQRSGSPPAALPTTLSATGLLNAASFSNSNPIAAASGFTGYDVANPLWSDRAHKERWFGIPDGQKMGYAATGDWSFPQGSVFVKHFELPIDDNNPNARKRLETRILVRDDTGYVYGMTYKWRPDNSDADLVTSGFTEEVPVTGNVDLGTLTSTDIGGAAAGATEAFNGGHAVTGGGADIFGTSDQFRFLHTQKTGDFDIATRLESLDRADLYTKAGLMARESLAANARNVLALVFPTNEARNNNTGGYEFQSRDNTGGGSAALYPAAPQPAVRYPNAWLRLKRAGDTFTAYWSRDGVNWNLYATKFLDLPDTVYFGMAITAHNAAATATARFHFNVNRTQPWYFPGRQDCLACHTNVSGGVLGINTPISNRNYAFAATGVTDNQLRAWNHVGYLNHGLGDEAAFEAAIPGLHKMAAMNDTTASAEVRMRSYLDSNCAHCHRPGGVHAFWDAQFETPLAQAGIINGIVQQTLGVSGAKVLVPDAVDRSIMHKRMATATEHYKMPPLAKNIVDQSAIALLEQWIEEAVQPPAEALPTPWVHADIGNVGFAGDATYATTAETFILSASG